MRISRHFMKSKEFRERQLWLAFECAAGIALRAIADGMDEARRWFRGWVKVFRFKANGKTSKPVQFELVLLQRVAALGDFLTGNLNKVR